MQGGFRLANVGLVYEILLKYGYATEYKKLGHAKCFLNSWYFGGYGPGYGMLFRL